MSADPNQELAASPTPSAGQVQWEQAWVRALPILALIGPCAWLVAALVRATGIGKLEGDLDWISRPEGLIMFLGVPFFVATFVYIGWRLAERAVRAGIAVTALGVLGVAPLAAISAFRLFMGQFTDAGFDPDGLNEAFEAMSAWDLGFFLLNLGQFLAWLIAGIVILRTKVAPNWVGISFILGVICVLAAQGAYIALEVLWPLGAAFWFAGVWGLIGQRSGSPAVEEEINEPNGDNVAIEGQRADSL